MATLWERLYSAFERKNHLADLPLSLRAAQETFLLQLLAQPRYSDPRHLARFEHQVYSQNGEDGVIAEILRRINAPSRTFLEIGVGKGLQNNTAFLLAQGWSGLWLEGSPNAVAAIQATFRRQLASSALRVREMFITAENIREALKSAGDSDEPDVFSLDIDRNTYWIWDALPNLRPRIIVVEYNATMPAELDWKIPYDGGAMWDGSLYYGASLKAFELLGRARGYSLVHCDLSGTNAFFVRNDLCEGHFEAPFDAATRYEPARYWLLRQTGSPPSASMFA